MASLGGSSWSAAAAPGGGGRWDWSTGGTTGGRSADAAAVGERPSSSSSAYYGGGGQFPGGLADAVVGMGRSNFGGTQSSRGGGAVLTGTVREGGEIQEGHAVKELEEMERPTGYGAAVNAGEDWNMCVAAPAAAHKADMGLDVGPQRDVFQASDSAADAAYVSFEDQEVKKKGGTEQPAAPAARTGFLSPFAAMAERAGSLFGPAR